jgi:small subunit ribosomal protein S4e
VLLRNRLKYALTYKEAMMILKQRQIEVDGRVRTDVTFPAGFMGASHFRVVQGGWYGGPSFVAVGS